MFTIGIYYLMLSVFYIWLTLTIIVSIVQVFNYDFEALMIVLVFAYCPLIFLYFLKNKVKKAFSVRSHLDNKKFNKNLKKIKIQGENELKNLSESADLNNISELCKIILEEVSEKAKHITENNQALLKEFLVQQKENSRIPIVYDLHQLLIDTRLKVLNERVSRFLNDNN